MKKLSKKQLKEAARITAELQKKQARIDEVAGTYNQAVADYSEIVNEANNFAEEIAAAIEKYIGEKSDKWQEGDKGQAYQDWLSEWQNYNLDEVDTVDVADKPEGLDDLPTEVG